MTLTGADVPRIFSTGSLTVTNSKLSRMLKKIKQHTVTNAHWYNRTINYKITEIETAIDEINSIRVKYIIKFTFLNSSSFS